MTRLEDYDTEERFSAKVRETTLLTPADYDDEVRNLVLEVDRADFTFRAGQSIGVIAPGRKELGQDEHFRLYTVANSHEVGRGKPRIEICVKRCFYIDEVSGERYKGVASNYLCDRKPGDVLTITGPYGLPFEVPDDKHADILMIGLGTGIAPFRAFVRHIYEEIGGWEGKVRLFYGAKSGLELLYMNDRQNDFASYYDEKTFQAFEAVSPHPYLLDEIPLEHLMKRHADEVWSMIMKPDTHVFVAGLENMREPLDKAFTKMAGSFEKWQRRKAELAAGGRWVELIY
jgi:ferredoxin--NADP+ reductase